RDGQERLLTAWRADQLHAEWKSRRPEPGGKAERGETQERDHAVEDRVAGAGEPLRGLSRRARGQEHVQPAERLRHRGSRLARTYVCCLDLVGPGRGALVEQSGELWAQRSGRTEGPARGDRLGGHEHLLVLEQPGLLRQRIDLVNR